MGKSLSAAREEAARVIEEAEERKKELLLEAKEEALQIRAGAENELRERRREAQRLESRLSNREENLERRQESLEQRERTLQGRERELEQAHSQLEELRQQQQQQLEAIASLTANEARDQIMRKAEAEAQHELARHYHELAQRMGEEADQKARKIVTLAIHRLASDVVAETTTKVVPLPSDDMKGRLIGREGRNIRAIEAATGVDLIIDDTPGAVTISCFDPVRREVARVALNKLILDGRIHPARIEETVQKAHTEVDETIWQEGEKAVFEAGVRGPVAGGHPAAGAPQVPLQLWREHSAAQR